MLTKNLCTLNCKDIDKELERMRVEVYAVLLHVKGRKIDSEKYEEHCSVRSLIQNNELGKLSTHFCRKYKRLKC